MIINVDFVDKTIDFVLLFNISIYYNKANKSLKKFKKTGTCNSKAWILGRILRKACHCNLFQMLPIRPK